VEGGSLPVSLPADEPQHYESDQDTCDQPINEIAVHTASISCERIVTEIAKVRNASQADVKGVCSFVLNGLGAFPGIAH
jgi:hypothetical protein